MKGLNDGNGDGYGGGWRPTAEVVQRPRARPEVVAGFPCHEDVVKKSKRGAEGGRRKKKRSGVHTGTHDDV